MRFGIPAAILGSLYRKDTGLGLPCWPWRVTTMYSTVTFFPGATCSEGIRTLHSAFPARHATNPVVQLTGIHSDLDYSLLPKEEPRHGRHGRYLCLDPFLTVCTNGSPALSSREASQYSSALQGKSPYFRNVSPSQALGTFLLPRPSQPTARPQSDCNSEKAEALLLQSQTDTTEALFRRHTPPCSFSVLPFLMVYF